jgi:glycosyltransferase involved in cell wall biosynthesis
MPLLSSALKNCLGVVCHSEMAKCSATSMGIPALRTELPFATSSAPRQTIRTGPLRIVQFGYLNPYRRTLEILELLAKWPHRQAVRFDIYGQLWDEPLVQKRVLDLDLADLVTIHGFAEENHLNLALAAADLVLNLRYPTMGEASGSQMRIWSVSVPSVVPAIGWFAELPDDGVIKISIAHEADELRTILEAMLQDRYCFDDIGYRGRQILDKRHSPATYAATLMRAVNDLPALRRRTGSLMAVEAASRRVWGSGSVLPSPALGLGALGDLCDLFVPRGDCPRGTEDNEKGGPQTPPMKSG